MEWPATATQWRAARAQVVAQIAASGMSPDEARDRNQGDGWTVAAPDGSTVVWRWVRGEFAVIANALRGKVEGWQ